MNIAKVIKYYFYFTMIIVTVASLTFQSDVKNYIASVFNADAVSGFVTDVPSFYPVYAYGLDSSKLFVSYSQNPDLLSFDFADSSEGNFAESGASDVHVMDIALKTYGEPASLKSIRFKISGVDKSMILDSVLMYGNEIVGRASQSGDYLVFGNVNFSVEPDSEKSLSLYFDLSPELRTGQRIRADIETPEDIVLFVGKNPYTVNKYYPIKGRYLTIARPR
ncbi:MAG: hypothetical protein ABIH78_02840 [Candidatus Peregrinibacteria bacterium]